jgi:2-methylcitrate dehydratase
MQDATAESISKYAAELSFETLRPEAVHAAKRSLIDSIGCALGAYAAKPEPVEVGRRLASRIQSTTPATVLGTRERTSPEMATFVNGSMVRYLDFNDDYLNNDGPHPSDNIAGVLATCEATNRGGKDLVCGIALAYEVVGQLVDHATFKYRGWDYVTETSIGTAVACGNVMGLSAEQMGHCLALAIAPNIALFQNRAGELSMWKGCAGPNASRNGVFAAQLAAEGMTGPNQVIEGKWGLWNQVTGPFTLGAFGGADRPFKIERTFFKPKPMMYTCMLPVETALAMRDEVKIDDIAGIRIFLDRFCLLSSNGKERFDPQTRETADHSIPYLVVAALLDGEISDESFTRERYRGAKALALLRMTTMAEDPSYTVQWPDPFNCRIEISTKDGRVHTRHGVNPKGHPSNPMSDGELDAKFMELACRALPPEQAKSALALLWRVEEATSVSGIFEAVRIRA